MFAINNVHRSAHRRICRSVTLGEALGAKEGEALELNTAEAATCGRCGKEPRLYHHVSPKGRDVIVWIPVEHACLGRKAIGGTP